MGRSRTSQNGLSLFHCPEDLDSQRLRWMIAEKGIEAMHLIAVEAGDQNEDLLVLNARHDLPTLVERNLVVAGIDIIAEYLDERYPFPPMMPSDPAGRARLRMTARILRDDLEDPLECGASKKTIAAALVGFDSLLGQRKFLLGASLSLADIYLMPMLWRLKTYAYSWPASCATLRAYAQRMSQRPAFQASLTRAERALGAV